MVKKIVISLGKNTPLHFRFFMNLCKDGILLGSPSNEKNVRYHLWLNINECTSPAYRFGLTKTLTFERTPKEHELILESPWFTKEEIMECLKYLESTYETLIEPFRIFVEKISIKPLDGLLEDEWQKSSLVTFIEKLETEKKDLILNEKTIEEIINNDNPISRLLVSKTSSNSFALRLPPESVIANLLREYFSKSENNIFEKLQATDQSYLTIFIGIFLLDFLDKYPFGIGNKAVYAILDGEAIFTSKVVSWMLEGMIHILSDPEKKGFISKIHEAILKMLNTRGVAIDSDR